MLTRILTALVGIPIVIAVVFWPGGLPFTVLIAMASLIALFEFYKASKNGGIRPHSVIGFIAAVALLYLCRSHDKLDCLAPIVTLVIITSLGCEMFRDERKPYANVGATILGLLYVVGLMLNFLWLRGIQGKISGVMGMTLERGACLVMMVLLCTWAVDTGAYFAGSWLGKTKLIPQISPKKTVEGSIGGLLLAILVGAGVASLIQMPIAHGLILGGLIGIVGQLGDLAASMFKREVGVKDFGNLLPGHGGMLDRIDSLLFAAPIAFLYISIILHQI